jgi:hypothetical protein
MEPKIYTKKRLMMTKTIFFILFFLNCPLQAAAPVAHVYFAQLWMEINEINDLENQNAFIAGTLFPDIRYLGTIARSQTHEKGITPEKIRKTQNMFHAGMRVHAYLDIEREKVVKKSKISLHFKAIPSELRVLFLKTLEDEILWDRVNCAQVAQALTSIYFEELEAGVTEAVALEWHERMIEYFCEKPSRFLKARAEKGLGFLNADQKTIAEWSLLLPIYAENSDFIHYIADLIQSMNQKFQKP